MSNGAANLAAAEAKMRAGGVSELGIAAFHRLYGLLVAGDRGLLPTAELTPATGLPSYDDLPAPVPGSDALDRAVVIKLNGGLGTTMGLAGPKSLIEVKPGVSFLDVIARQVLHLRRTTGARLPLVLMNSYVTRDASLAALAAHPELASDVPADFVQHREPRLLAATLSPVSWPDNPELEWCPPGHGDLYAAIAASGMLDELRKRNYRYAFVSNADNLGASLDPRVIEWLAAGDIPFAMEVIEGTAADRKGGHIAVRDGQLVLRETAQVPAEDEASFRDYRRWRYYNTNNLYLDLDALAAALDAGDGVLPLALIVNRKVVDPTVDGAPEVIQLETAMGSALGVFPGARALVTPRTRFAPVKSTEDLLVVRSDFYSLGGDGRAVPADPSGRPPLVELDSAYYKRLPDFEQRFPHGAPSLRRATRLTVQGDVTFGRDVTVVGEATVTGPVPDGAVLGDG